MLTIFAFIVAIGALVVVHELGHFWMARACGVKVLRFSVGFGPKLVGWTSPKSGTEFVLSALPLGGFVKMLDAREGAVPADQISMEFNAKSVGRRAAIVATGPLANLGLALFLYAAVNWTGMEHPQAVLAKPVPGSVFADAGFVGGERIVRAAYVGDDLQEVRSFEDLRWWVTRAALEHQDMVVEYVDGRGTVGRLVQVPLSGINENFADAHLLQKIGIIGPYSQAQMGDLMEGGAAREAGLQLGDIVLRLDEAAIIDAAQLRELIRSSGRSGSVKSQVWQVKRNGIDASVQVTPKIEWDAGKPIGRVGAFIGAPPAMVVVRYGLWDGIERAARHTWEVSVLTLQMMGQILIGEASLKNLSGPITIADYAGKSAAVGMTQYLLFLALISISLGVLNLLPLPVLDGGHLMYYVWEWISGKPVSDGWMERMQRVGFAILLVMMCVAVFNDVTRLLG